ncbi:MAG: hypothetical protein JRD89_20270, partial [Deltaproteobacteria bacterium]|nr:hypothetical protein [Deltaproteobacteria bacterium]
ELSFGSHFFLDLVEMRIFYLALFPDQKEVTFNTGILDTLPNILTELVPDSGAYQDIVTVCDFGEQEMQLVADIISQRVLCFSQS